MKIKVKVYRTVVIPVDHATTLSSCKQSKPILTIQSTCNIRLYQFLAHCQAQAPFMRAYHATEFFADTCHDNIIKMSINSGTCNLQWKNADITPIYKKEMHHRFQIIVQ